MRSPAPNGWRPKLRHAAHLRTTLRVVDRVAVGTLLVFGGYYVVYYLSGLQENPTRLFHDADIYYRATAVWLAGGDPWAVQSDGWRFAGIPPTLLLNVPLQPFGEAVATPFWAIAGLLSGPFVMRRLRLQWWWVGFTPYWEAVLNGSPDPVLLAAILSGGGGIAAFVKPYAAPGLLAVGRWRSFVAAGVLGVLSLATMPWPMYVAQTTQLVRTFDVQSLHTSAWGVWWLAIPATVALASLGPRLALGLVVPVLWPLAQLHYGLFSVPALARMSALWPLALSWPHLAAPAVVTLAVARRLAGDVGEGGRATGVSFELTR